MKWLAALVVLAVAIAYARRERPVPATRYADDDVQPWDARPYDLTTNSTTNLPSVTVSLDGQTFTYASGSSRDWRN